MRIQITNRDLGSSETLNVTLKSPNQAILGKIEIGRKWITIRRPGKKVGIKMRMSEFMEKMD